MKKKKLTGNGKILFTITMIFVVCCLMATGLWAAKKVEFYSANAKDYIRLLNENGSCESSSIGKILGLTRDEGFLLLRQRTDFNGVTHYRYQQAYKRIPLWGMQAIVSKGRGNQLVGLHGAVVQGAPKDIGAIPAKLDAPGALNRMKTLHKEKNIGATWHFKNEKYGTYIYLHHGKARLCHVVSFFADTECGDPSQPIFFIDARSGKVLHSFDMLRYQCVGPGGNLKVGYYYYGIDYPPFGCTNIDGMCYLDTEDVRTIDLNGGSSGGSEVVFPCYENVCQPINGAYCPVNDAQFFGQVVFDMYRDYYGVPVLTFQLTLRCHFGFNYENVFWDGSSITFGDGYITFYPLVALDVVAHEASHGFTEYHSGLIYSGQSGGINEAYSDMAGESAKHYLRGTNDFMFAFDIVKAPAGAVRYMYDPPLDGYSIDHIDDYYEGMDVHYSSGIFNKAFWLIATSPDWTTRMAFDIFAKANMDYWQPDTNFQQGAEGARDAALDYGYSCEAVRDAFAVVGINLTCTDPCPGTIVNPGFETGDTSGWTGTGDITITSDSHTGSYAVSLNGANSSVEQVVTNLCGSRTYTVSCWGKAKSPAGVYLGVKDYGGTEQTVKFTDSKNFVKKSITFTTGTANTSATVFFIKLDSKFTGIGDDFEIN
ncbi:M4 family metallopeptidase [Acidobacteriota bacterium]